MRPPPLKKQPNKDKADAAREWVGAQLRLLGMNARDILEQCIKSAAEKYRGCSEDDLGGAVEDEVQRQMKTIQVLPPIMDEYRRFVVITVGREEVFKDGVSPP